MAFGKPNLRDGVIPYLAANVEENNGLTAERFLEVMGYNIPLHNKVSILRSESGRATNTVKGWIRKHMDDQEGKG